MNERFIKNYSDLRTSKEREFVLDLIEEGIASVHPDQFLKNSLKFNDGFLQVKNKKFDFKNKRLFVLGAGKASAAMAVQFERIVGVKNIAGGIVLTNDKSADPKKIKVHFSDHPIPSQAGVTGTKRILDLKDEYDINENDFIVVLLSGGGSSLMPLPIQDITLEDKIKMIEVLISTGANVHEMTILKKKLSQVKGGKLAEYFKPAKIVSLVLSDVVDNDEQVIASGPFTEDRTTFKDAWQVIEKYDIKDRLPDLVLKYFKKYKDDISEKKDFFHVDQFLLADNNVVLNKIEKTAEENGYKVFIQREVQGEASVFAKQACKYVFEEEIKEPTLFLYGGETTVTLNDKNGKGGRNQEIILSCLDCLQKMELNYNWCIASVGTDGIDYIEESAGGIIDSLSLTEIKKKKIDTKKFLKQHDSFNILTKINSNIFTGGATGTNVCDIMIFLVIPK